MIIEPNSDLPQDIYKDWLADQGYDELRDVDFYSLMSEESGFSPSCHTGYWGPNNLENQSMGDGSHNSFTDDVETNVWNNYMNSYLQINDLYSDGGTGSEGSGNGCGHV